MAMQRFQAQLTTAPREAFVAVPHPRADAVDAIAVQFDGAMQHFDAGEWSEAFAELCVLADRGHPSAARIALMLAHRGTSLFGGSFTATREQQMRWLRHGGI